MLTTENTEKKKSSPRRLRVRKLVKLALLVVFIAVLIPVLQILVPAVAYRDDLIALLNYSDDCKAPCFMGITPGQIWRDETLEILESHPWVGEIHTPVEFFDTTPGETVSWNWSGRQPSYLKGRASVRFEYDMVSLIFINFDNMPFTTLLLTLGAPDWMAWGIVDRPEIDAGYLDEQLGFVVYCSPDAYALSKSSLLYAYFGNPPVVRSGKPFSLSPYLQENCGM